MAANASQNRPTSLFGSDPGRGAFFVSFLFLSLDCGSPHYICLIRGKLHALR